MFKMRVALMGAMALLVVSGFAASTASALGPYWHVNGVKLTTQSKAINLQLKGVAKLSVSNLALVIECKASSSEGATIEGNGTKQGKDKGKIKYTECKNNQKECEVVEPITTNETKSYLGQLKSGAIVDVFEPTVGKVFVEIQIKGVGSCPTLVKGKFPVDGSVAAEVKPENKEVKEGDLQFTEPAIKTIKHEGTPTAVGLTFGGATNEATFSAGYGAQLESGEVFGVTEL
jgi:hypothetical protein